MFERALFRKSVPGSELVYFEEWRPSRLMYPFPLNLQNYNMDCARIKPVTHLT